MKSVNVLEIDEIVKTFSLAVGAIVNSIVVSKQDVLIRLSTDETVSWMQIDLSPQSPFLFFFPHSSPMRLSKTRSPLGLFFEAHFVGETLVGLQRDPSLGRVVDFEFSNQKKMRLILITHASNLILETPEKSISFKKPKALTPHKDDDGLELRSLDQLKAEWLARRLPANQKNRPSREDLGVDLKAKALKKLESQIKKINAEILKKQKANWRDLGNWLVENQSLEDVPKEFTDILDADRDLAGNIQACFENAKKQERKIETLQQRAQIREERRKLSQQSAKNFEIPRRSQRPQPTQKAKELKGVKTRKKELSDEIQVYVGKSAKDNLQLLRSARSWDFWLHLRDVPSAHAILRRAKNQNVTEQVIQSAAQFLVEVSQQKKSDRLLETRVEVIVAECRHVRPIKGDRAGRVRFQNEKTVVVNL